MHAPLGKSGAAAHRPRRIITCKKAGLEVAVLPLEAVVDVGYHFLYPLDLLAVAIEAYVDCASEAWIEASDRPHEV